MCGKKGIMGGDLGDVVFRNITVADNRESGVEFERIVLGADQLDVMHSENIFVVGQSNGNPGVAGFGIVAPQSDLYFVTDARFYNFPTGAALSDCSHCMTPKADSGARTTRFSNLQFDDDTVNARIRWSEPWKGIFHDLDGTLTGHGADSYVSAYW
jgi:hypothetical protein